MLLMKTLDIPVVATIHHPLCLDRKEDLAQARSFWEKLRRIIFYPFFMQDLVSRRMDRVITDSLSSQADIKSIFKVPESKLRLIYVGVDVDIFRNDDSLSKQPNSLIMVGNTEDRKKGVLYLLQAVRLLKEDIPIKLTIVDAPDPDEGFAPSLVREYGLEDIVTFTGRLTTPELVRHYCQAEIGVTASTVEGFGLPAAEAMACSTPVVATTAGALPEVVQDGVTGILVPPANPQALAGAIKLLLGDEALRRKMGEEGRKRVEHHFSWRETAVRTLEVYSEVQSDNKLRVGLLTSRL
jgi:glycosyltransferase involved in cell wall biosynthesis